jgi:arylsulfatase A-like enzyme
MSRTAASRTRPNVILINCDDLGWGDLSCYGHPLHSTPHLDRLAEDGTRFTEFYSASPLCSPSRGALLTGCYPRRIGFGLFDGAGVLFPGDPIGLDPGETTIASMLKANGYATRIIGKWHCGDQPEFLPTRHGFDGYYGIPYSNDMGRQVGQRPWPPLPLMRDDQVVEEQPDQVSLTMRYTEDAVRFFRAHRDSPFFLYFAHMYVHLPIYVPDRFLAESRNGPYGGAVAAIDWSVGVIVDELRRLGIAQDTIIMFTSDNGSRADFGPSNGYLRGIKGTTWEGGQREPFIAWWPGHVPSGRVAPGILSMIDLLPTIATLCDVIPPADRRTDGIDCAGFLTGEVKQSPREEFLYYSGDTLNAVRAGRWKLHVHRDGESITELYDLDTDPGERTECASQNLGVVTELKRRCDRAREDLGDAATGAPGDVRQIGRVAHGRTLTSYDPTHPYYRAEYDLPDRG